MWTFPMRCLACISLAGCAGVYRHLQPVPGSPACVQAFKPALGRAVYKTSVDVVGKHLDGLLIMKTMSDSSTRIVFTNQAGPTFFDLGWAPHDTAFIVYHIIDQMDKKAVIETLRKDFELVLLKHASQGRILTDGTNRYYAFSQEKGTNYYITDSTCTHLLRAEKASSRSRRGHRDHDGLPGRHPRQYPHRAPEIPFHHRSKTLRMILGDLFQAKMQHDLWSHHRPARPERVPRYI